MSAAASETSAAIVSFAENERASESASVFTSIRAPSPSSESALTYLSRPAILRAAPFASDNPYSMRYTASGGSRSVTNAGSSVPAAVSSRSACAAECSRKSPTVTHSPPSAVRVTLPDRPAFTSEKARANERSAPMSTVNESVSATLPNAMSAAPPSRKPLASRTAAAASYNASASERETALSGTATETAPCATSVSPATETAKPPVSARKFPIPMPLSAPS